MKKAKTPETGPADVRFHVRRHDGLFAPIPFLFVTERMCDEIEAERETILACCTKQNQQRQQSIFTQYDPRLSASAFQQILGMFGHPLEP